MPNWCNNRLVVRGDEKLLKKFLEKATNAKGEFTFEKMSISRNGRMIPTTLSQELTGLNKYTLKYKHNQN